MNFTMKSESQNIKTNFKFDGESQSFMLSLSYKINNYNKRHEETLDKNFGGGI